MRWNDTRPAGTRRRGGWVIADAVIGLLVVGAAAAVLTTALRMGRDTADRLADGRAAERLVERCLIAARDGRPLPEVPAGGRAAIVPTAGGVAPSGMAWATAEVTVRGRHAALVGMVPVEATRGGRP